MWVFERARAIAVRPTGQLPRRDTGGRRPLNDKMEYRPALALRDCRVAIPLPPDQPNGGRLWHHRQISIRDRCLHPSNRSSVLPCGSRCSARAQAGASPRAPVGPRRARSRCRTIADRRPAPALADPDRTVERALREPRRPALLARSRRFAAPVSTHRLPTERKRTCYARRRWPGRDAANSTTT
jgi:hypothetical protein